MKGINTLKLKWNFSFCFLLACFILLLQACPSFPLPEDPLLFCNSDQNCPKGMQCILSLCQTTREKIVLLETSHEEKTATDATEIRKEEIVSIDVFEEKKLEKLSEETIHEEKKPEKLQEKIQSEEKKPEKLQEEIQSEEKKGECMQDTDCAHLSSTPFCHKDSQRCVQCLGDDSCPLAFSCNGYVCQAISCSISSDCPKGSFCSQTKCAAKECETTSSCSNGKACMNFQCKECSQPLDCGTGFVCNNKNCQVGNCLSNAECSNGEVCKSLQCTNCSVDLDCNTGQLCDPVQQKCIVSLMPDNGGQKWSDGKVALSCQDYQTARTGYQTVGATDAENGVYWIQPTLSSSAFLAYCWMDANQNGGGWTLAMKQNPNQANFSYNSSYWKDSTSLNPSSTNLEGKDAKFESFWTVPVQEVWIGFSEKEQPLASEIKSVKAVVCKQNCTYTLKDIFSIGTLQEFLSPPTTQDWLNTIPSSQIQIGCSKQGFNLEDLHPGKGGLVLNVRIGILASDSGDCFKTSSFFGMGNQTSPHSGNAFAPTSNDTLVLKPAYGYLFVR